MKKTLTYTLGVFTILILIYVAGPQNPPPVLSSDFPSVPSSLLLLEDSITTAEYTYKDSIKENCESQIYWQGDSIHKTQYSVIYLHGYSATKYEGLPVATDYAQRYGMNLYIPRLQDHGFITPDPLLHMTATGLWESAKNALAVGEKIGDKVIIMSTSTGGTLALYLAAIYPDKIHALINISPNILPATTGVKLLSKPWGLQIARIVQGGKRMKIDKKNAQPLYWSEGPRLESAVELQHLVDATMTHSTFTSINTPSLTLAYYKDDKNQDRTVRVDKIKEMHSLLSSPIKSYVELPTVGVHPMACGIISHDIPAVENTIYKFTEKFLGIEPKYHKSISDGDM